MGISDEQGAWKGHGALAEDCNFRQILRQLVLDRLADDDFIVSRLGRRQRKRRHVAVRRHRKDDARVVV
jgi:hypothetical protein